MACLIFDVIHCRQNPMTEHFTLLAIMGLFIFGCAGTGPKHQKALKGLERFDVVVSTDSSTMTDFVILRPAEDTVLRSLQEISLLFVHSDTTILKMPMTITSMGAPGRSETVTTSIACRVSTDALPKYDSLAIEATTNSHIARYGVDRNTSGLIVRSLTSQKIVGAPKDSSALQLLTSYAQDGNEYTFTATALRRREVPGEYFPSSEQLRIRIINGKGAVVWSSSDGLAFLTMVNPVEPAGVGEMHEYRLTWNGLQSDGTPLPAGRYAIEFTLPVKPLAYSTTVMGTFPLE